ncbi:serine/threonine-protein kinase [Streptomyces sp. Ag109_G2-15]|uniref:serine/threonine-protein kinase n=1 Tax=Streptomyces sp. Ag109_G2-15 TaxID=1938850 RepID=UPI000BD82D49|nr:serine/threonine-protein kinase [Streptomyces sp. Ag109_G2-15]SOD84445.1 PQQ-like domain-containing protein [Streptomyces sp. Ag109_G2-15]
MKPLDTGDPIRLGPYRLLGVLGEGGMGRVYFGQDRAGRMAAVKVLHRHLADDPHLVQRFVREARMAQAVTGPGVARVLDTETEGGRPWIATEFLTGPTLEEAVTARGPLDDNAVRALATALARALRDIHAAGLVHRDLKPANVVLTSTGPRIIDFGIARPEHGLTLTTTGQVPVTPGFGAPEQALGHRVGPPADVFSLGALLVYAASGRRPYDGSHVAAVQYEVVHGTPRMDGVPPVLQTLIAPCLTKDPAHRPTPTAIAQAFAPPRGTDRVWRQGPIAEDIQRRERALHELTTLPGTSAPGGLPRRRLLKALTIGAPVAVAGAGGTTWWLWRRNRNAPFDIPPAAPTPQARPLSASKGDYVVGQTPDPIWHRASALSTETPAPLPVRDVLIVGNPKGGVSALNVVDGKPRWSAPEAVATSHYVSLSDRLIAAVADDGTLLTFVASTGEPKWTARADAASVLAADDEAVYVVTDDGRLRAIGRSDGRVRWTRAKGPALGTPTGTRGLVAQGVLLVTTEDGDVLAVHTNDGRTAWSLSAQADGRVKVSAAGRYVFLSGERLTARNAATGKEQWRGPAPLDGRKIGWGPSVIHGKYLYAAASGAPVRLDIGTGKTTDWVYHNLFTCDPPSPLVIQGKSFWSISVNATEGGVNALYLAEDYTTDVDSPARNTTWTFRIIKNPTRYWMTADANRVFIVDGASLTALPVF